MASLTTSLRTLCVIVDQWDAYVAEKDPVIPLAVLASGRVRAANPAALSSGVRTGMKRRDAQAVCPELRLSEQDPDESARAFEVILRAVEEFVPRIEIVEPGHCLVPTLGPARYHGGEGSLASQLSGRLRSVLDPAKHPPVVGIGVADGPRTASMASLAVIRRQIAGVSPSDEALFIAPGESAGFLAPLSIGYLEPMVGEESIDLFRRLGLKSVRSFAALESRDVLARFGSEALNAHRLANGEEREPPKLDNPDVDVRATRTMEPPLERIDQIAFTAKAMAGDLVRILSSRGLTSKKVLIIAETEAGARIERVWQTERGFSVSVITQRVRWQLEGWLANGRSRSQLQGAVSFLQIEPNELRPEEGEQVGFWGGTDRHDQLVMNGMARIQALFGVDSVRVPRLQGGRSPRDDYRLVGIESVEVTSTKHGSGDTTPGPDAPWPGSIPQPSPSRIWAEPVSAEVIDKAKNPVRVSGRGTISAAPALVSIAGGPWLGVESWAGPWCVDERWWDPVLHRRKARVQALLGQADAPSRGARHPSRLSAHLLTLEAGQWWVEATYD